MTDCSGSTVRPYDQTALAAMLTTKRMSSHHANVGFLVGAADIVKYLSGSGNIAG